MYFLWLRLFIFLMLLLERRHTNIFVYILQMLLVLAGIWSALGDLTLGKETCGFVSLSNRSPGLASVFFFLKLKIQNIQI